MQFTDGRPSVDPSENSTMKEALEWHQKFEPIKDCDYKPALDYAKSRYQECREVTASIEKKAEWFLAIATASIGGTVWILEKTAAPQLNGLPAMMLFLVSIWFCIRVRSPGSRTTTYEVSSFIGQVERYRDLADSWMAASYHYAIEGVDIINSWKGRQINYAARFQLAGALILVLTISLGKSAHHRENSPPLSSSQASVAVSGAGPAARQPAGVANSLSHPAPAAVSQPVRPSVSRLPSK